MNIGLCRFADLDESTIGALYIDDRFCCFTLEDQAQPIKIAAETRIPRGVYPIKLRTEGQLHAKYAGKFPEHRGMLWLQGVPEFEWVYIHVGNTDDHTAGCVLVGDTAFADGRLGESQAAYRRLYGQVCNALLAGEPVEISVEDL
jgi:hypothetical protein